MRSAQRRRIQHELVNVLTRTRLMQVPGSRQTMLEHLQDRLGQLPLREHAEVRIQVAEIVRACLPNAVPDLVDVVEHLEPDTDECLQLHRLGDEWDATDVLVDEDWTGLRPALEAVTPTNLTLLCQQATEHRLLGPPPWCANAWQVFVHLAGHNAGRDALPPSMVFLVLLEQQVEPEVAERIRRRNRQQATSQALTPALDGRRADISRGKDLPRDSTAYLVIQVEPDLDPSPALTDQESYLVSHFRQWHSGDSWHSRAGTTRTVRFDDLEREVEQLVEEMEADWSNRPGTVVVEFVLPWNLLNEEVDWWHKESASSRPTALAMDYPVVVRSLERLRTPRWHRYWHQKWEQLRSAPASSRAHWSRPTGTDHYFTQLEAELKADQHLVSLILSEPPTRHGRSGLQEIEAAMRAGVPVIIWHRGDCLSGAFKDTVTRLISDGGLAQLPLRAKQLRQEALRLEPEQRKDHIGRHLTVLWDDPERKPDPLGSAGRRAGEIH